MYFQECEHLVNKFPELKNLCLKIDDILYHSTPSSVLKPDTIAGLLNEKESQVIGIFEILNKDGLLRKEKYIECTECENLMKILDYKKALVDEDSFECTRCQSDLTKQVPNKVEVYRLNPNKVELKKDTIDQNDATKRLEFSQNFHEVLPKTVKQEPFKYTPLLSYYSRDPNLLKEKPFQDMHSFILLHFLKDIIPFVKACENLGMNLKNTYFFYKDYPYPQRDAIKDYFEKQGAVVEPRSYISQRLKQFSDASSGRIKKILIIEDGGFIVPSIHTQFPNLINYVVGAVEQTTRGARNDSQIKKLKFPILSVATSKIKNTFEPPYIAEAVIDNIKRLLSNISLKRKRATVFGFGAIGGKVAEWLKINGVNVTVVEPSSEKILPVIGFDIADSPGEAVRNRNFVIGTSGNTSIDSKVIANLTHDTYLLSASSELYEIDIDELDRQSKSRTLLRNDNYDIGTTYILHPNRHIHLLANGYPINFWGFNSMPEEASDLIMSLILLSAAEMAIKNYPEPKINSDAVNEIAEKYKIAEKFLEFHKQG